MSYINAKDNALNTYLMVAYINVLRQPQTTCSLRLSSHIVFNLDRNLTRPARLPMAAWHALARYLEGPEWTRWEMKKWEKPSRKGRQGQSWDQEGNSAMGGGQWHRLLITHWLYRESNFLFCRAQFPYLSIWDFGNLGRGFWGMRNQCPLCKVLEVWRTISPSNKLHDYTT